jgi:hypothetical protein
MADIWILCEDDGTNLTPVAVGTAEASTRELAGDGNYLLVPINFNRIYPNIIDRGIVGVTGLTNTSLQTLIAAAKTRLDAIDVQLNNIITQGQAMNTQILSIDARVTDLENI